MSKAEQRALETYPIKIAQREGYDENLRERKGFIKGYHQAEKDLELSCDDIMDILNLYDEVIEMDFCEDIYGEILKRFKERKENDIRRH